MRKFITALAVAGLAAAGCTDQTPAPREPTAWEREQAQQAALTPLQKAPDTCGVTNGASTLDTGRTLTLRTWTVAQAGATNGQVQCVLKELKASDALWERISATRALDGQLSAEWAGYAATWSYHPDNGLNLIITTEAS